MPMATGLPARPHCGSAKAKRSVPGQLSVQEAVRVDRAATPEARMTATPDQKRRCGRGFSRLVWKIFSPRRQCHLRRRSLRSRQTLEPQPIVADEFGSQAETPPANRTPSRSTGRFPMRFACRVEKRASSEWRLSAGRAWHHVIRALSRRNRNGIAQCRRKRDRNHSSEIDSYR